MEFSEFLWYLLKRHHLETSAYERGGLLRRVERQMSQARVATFPDYRDHLEAHPEAVQMLRRMISMDATSWLRDPPAWHRLRDTIFPALANKREATEPIRMWSAGCSSGKEPFSLAIAWAEQFGLDDLTRRVTIYATDVLDEALAHARSALYLPRDMTGLDARLVDRYFIPGADGYTAIQDVKRAVVFGSHSLVSDPPLAHMDLIACRHVLRYLSPEARRRALEQFHFALNPTGVLFLATESLLHERDLFEPIDARFAFFRKVAATPRAAVGPTFAALAHRA